VVGFFNSYRQLYPVSRDVLRGAAEQFQSAPADERVKRLMTIPGIESDHGSNRSRIAGGFDDDNVAVGQQHAGIDLIGFDLRVRDEANLLGVGDNDPADTWL
jgi:hypothetical protein